MTSGHYEVRVLVAEKLCEFLSSLLSEFLFIPALLHWKNNNNKLAIEIVKLICSSEISGKKKKTILNCGISKTVKNVVASRAENKRL